MRIFVKKSWVTVSHPEESALKVESFDGGNEKAIAAEFRNRFLLDMARRETGLMAGEATSLGGVRACSAYAVVMPFVLVAGAAGGVVGAAVAAAAAGVGVAQACFNIAALIRVAGQEVTHALDADDVRNLPKTEAWMERNKDSLPGYLNALDKYEDDYRRAATLVREINNSGNAEAIHKGDRAFLTAFLKHWRYKNDKLKVPVRMPPRITSACFLSVWDQSRLRRVMGREILHRAGPEAGTVRQMARLLTGGDKGDAAPR